jgi:hypothetical protein
VAVTVTVDVTPVDPAGVPALTDGVPGEPLLQAANRVRPTTLIGSNNISCTPISPRLLLPTKQNTIASDEPDSSRPEVVLIPADATEVTVSVETIVPVDGTVTGEKLQVVPTGRPEHMNVIAELVEKPFCDVAVTVAVALVPVVSVSEPGETPKVKSCAGAPTAGVVALA